MGLLCTRGLRGCVCAKSRILPFSAKVTQIHKYCCQTHLVYSISVHTEDGHFKDKSTDTKIEAC